MKKFMINYPISQETSGFSKICDFSSIEIQAENKEKALRKFAAKNNVNISNVKRAIELKIIQVEE